MILNETNSDNRKTKNKNKNRTYSAVAKGMKNKDTNEKVISFQEFKANLVRGDASQSYLISPPVLSCDTSVRNNSSDQTDHLRMTSFCVVLKIFKMNQTLMIILFHLMNQ